MYKSYPSAIRLIKKFHYHMDHMDLWLGISQICCDCRRDCRKIVFEITSVITPVLRTILF